MIPVGLTQSTLIMDLVHDIHVRYAKRRQGFYEEISYISAPKSIHVHPSHRFNVRDQESDLCSLRKRWEISIKDGLKSRSLHTSVEYCALPRLVYHTYLFLLDEKPFGDMIHEHLQSCMHSLMYIESCRKSCDYFDN